MDRERGPSVRLGLTLGIAAFVLVAGTLMLGAVWMFVPRFVPGRDELWSVFAPRMAIALVLILILGLVAGWFVAGRVLAPLTRITDATRRAAAGSLSHRIEMDGRGDEFRDLADSFDTMLGRLDAHVAEQRRFAANVSHELRTPLAVTRAMLDVARDDPDHDTAALIERLHLVNSRAIDLTEALLLLSRADQGSFTPEHVDVSLVAEEATETLLPLAEKHGVSLETTGDVAPVVGSHSLLLQMTMNLVHNAISHNAHEAGTVWVTTTTRSEKIVLTVENAGPKLTPQAVATFTEPFQRGTGRGRSHHAGVGLGLAIVQSIVRAHDATLDLSARPAGGLTVTVTLRRDPRAGVPSGEFRFDLR